MSTDDRNNPGNSVTPAQPANSDPSIPRSALERVLARATELQTGTGETVDSISESRMLEIAREVGIPADNLRQALAEERSRLPYADDEKGAFLDAMGIAHVSAQRTVPGTPQTILAHLEPWMQRMESMTAQRRSANRITWEPVTSITNFMRPSGPTGRPRDLARVDQVTASITPVDETRSVVRFDAQLSGMRRTNRNLALGLGLGIGLPIVVLPALLLLLVNAPSVFGATMVAVLAAISGGLSFGIWRLFRNSYRRAVQRAQLRIDQLLDEIEHGTLVTTPSLLGQLRDAMISVTSAVRPPGAPQLPPGEK